MQKRRIQVALGIALVRGILAIFFGLALILNPYKSRPMLVNFMGMYWLLSGIISLRWGTAVRPFRRLALIAGTIGVLAGLVTLARLVIVGYLGEMFLLDLLGGIMAITGLFHVFGGFRTEDLSRIVTWGSISLGIFEIVLGILLVISTMEFGSGIYIVVNLWAFAGGFLILVDAWHIRAKMQQLSEQ